MYAQCAVPMWEENSSNPVLAIERINGFKYQYMINRYNNIIMIYLLYIFHMS
jgi:hypothetical protein